MPTVHGWELIVSLRRAAVSALLLPCVMVGQSATDRTQLQSLKDSISVSWDTTALLGLERQLIELARVERDNPIHHLRLGLLAMRLGTVEPNQPHLDDAIGEFEWAAELQPDWPWPWYGIGLAEASGRDRAAGFGGGLWTMLGLDRDRLAGAAFARAIEADPGFVGGLLEMAKVALAQRIDAPIEGTLLALRAATATMVGWEPRLLLARGRLERLAGFSDSAQVALRRASLLSRNPEIAQLELARTFPLSAGSDSASQHAARRTTLRYYLAAARSESPELLARFRRDIEPLATRSELARFDRLHGEARAEWLEEWWLTKDAIDLREPGSRLAEHFRRWDVAVREFRLAPFRRRYRFGMETFRSGDREFDDRGIVYLRHGEPSVRIVWPHGRTAARFDADPLRRSYGSESWRYDRPDGSLVLHFAAQFDQQDFRLVESPLDLDVARDQLARHAHEIPGLERLLHASENSIDWIRSDVRERVVRSMAVATRTDSWLRSYSDLLSGRVKWYVVGVRDGMPLVHIVYALDAETIRESGQTNETGFVPVHLRASFFDRRGRPVATLDTVQIFATPSDDAVMVTARAEVQVPPGALLTRLGIELSEESGVVYPIDSIVAPRLDAPQLEVSAVLVGKSGQSLPWEVEPADTVWLDAVDVYGPTDTLTLYAEGYGVTLGARAQVELAVTRQRGGIGGFLFGDHTALSIGDAIVANGPKLVFQRTLALNGLEPGDYSLDLTITVDGESVKRSRGIRVRR
jgi:hypothetical protein